MDVFPRDFRACFVSVDTALSLQLQDVCVPAPATSLPSRLARPDLLVSDAFIFDPVLGFVRRRLNHELTGFPILVRHFYKALDMSTLSLSPPFFRLCLPSNWLPGFAPPAKSFSIHPYLDHLSQLASRPLYRSSPQHFCKLATATLQRPPAHILLRPTIWRRFWRLSISHIARNIWFRALHRRLPVRQLLHSINASRFPTPHCPVCLSESEDLEHFLFSCPRKWAIWRALWIDRLLDNPSIESVRSAVFELQFPPDPPTISSSQVIACILEAICRCHWKLVFDYVPFLDDTIRAMTLTETRIFVRSRPLQA